MSIRAIVLEDDEQVRSILSEILKRRGYEVLPFSEPRFCPIYLERECTCPEDHACGDIFITDIHMPNMTGVEFLQNQLSNGCKVIVKNMALMSGAWTDEDREKARRLGCQIFPKPFRIDEIQKWLDDCEKRIDPERKLSEFPLRS